MSNVNLTAIATPALPRLHRRWSPGVLALAAILACMILPPLIYLFQTSLYTLNPDGSFKDLTLEYYIGVFVDPSFFRYALNTALYACGSSIVAITLGAAQAWIVERTDTPLRRYVFVFSIFSLGIPSVLSTIAWLSILGKAGPVNASLMSLMGRSEPVLDVYTMWGMIAIEGVNWCPLSFLMLTSVFRNADANFEEAAYMSGASISQTVFRITAKLAMPAVLALALLITIRAFESFEIPALVGLPGRIYVLSTDIYSDVHYSIPANFGNAGAFSIGLLAMVVVMLHFYNRLSRHADRYRTITGKGFRSRAIRLGRLRYLTATFLLAYFLVIVLLPIAYLIWASLMPVMQRLSLDSLQVATLKNYATVFRSRDLIATITNTLVLGACTATLAVALTVLCAWCIARRAYGAWILDILTTAPLVFPAIVLGVAFLQLFLQVPFPFYGTLTSIIYASCIRFLPYGMRYATVGLLQINPELEHAAEMSGASRSAIFFRITAPLLAPALISSWLLIFLLSVGAVSLPILLVGPDSSVVAVALFDMWESGQLTTLAAFGVSWAAFMTVISNAFYLFSSRYGIGRH